MVCSGVRAGIGPFAHLTADPRVWMQPPSGNICEPDHGSSLRRGWRPRGSARCHANPRGAGGTASATAWRPVAPRQIRGMALQAWSVDTRQAPRSLTLTPFVPTPSGVLLECVRAGQTAHTQGLRRADNPHARKPSRSASLLTRDADRTKMAAAWWKGWDLAEQAAQGAAPAAPAGPVGDS